MEMESSRGGGGRSRPPQPGGLKKPRLMSDDDQQRRSGVPPASVKARTFPTRPSATADPRLRKVTPTAVSGLKERDSSTTTLDTSRERDRGMSSFQLRQMQELLAEYKIALAELTFNSKPIITNMTIIAGENLEAAKGIAASICANILQVPSDQKLPSLYLLDSIVKNIGRDYIKHFAARLPEVFCKAYKQVDAPIHSGMRHLFGTWKGIFPPSALQYIEKELGFSSVANGSSAGVTTSRTDSQTARPPHSIHVNPKYLDAKQLLQNANRSKAVRSDIEDMDTERIDRSSVAGSARQWADPHAKNIHRPIRGLVNDTSTEMSEKSSSLSYGDNNKLMSDRSRFSDLKMGRNSKPVTEKATPDNSWNEVGNRNPDLSINQRNKSDALVHGNFKAPRSSQDSDQQFPINRSAIHKRNRVTPDIWKNAEEEEYMWDDKNSKLTGHFNNDSIKASIWASDDADKGRGLRREKCISTQWNRNEHYGQLDMTSGGEDRNPYFREFEENLPQSQIQRDARLRNQSNDFSDPLSVRGSFSGHHSSSSRPYQEPEFGHTRIGSRYSSQLEGNQVHSSSGLSTSYTPPHGSELQDFQESQPHSRASKKLAEILGESDQVISSKISAEPLPSIPSNPIHHQSHSLSILQQALSQSPHDNTISATSSPYIESWNLTPLLHSQTPVEVHPQISSESQRQSGIPYATTNSNAPEIESSGESSTSSLLASIIKSGLISKNPSSTFQHLNLQPPGPVQISDVSSVKIPLLSTESAKTLPLPPGPPLVSPATDTAEVNGYPLSSLLSSLVAKGLISSKVQEPQIQTGVQKPNEFSPTTHLSNSAVHATSIPDSSSNPSSASELSLPESSEAKEIAVPQDESFSHKDLIGVEFKPEVLRSFNPVVVSSLFDDLKHQCTICGLRFQLNNKLVSHFAWHDSKSSELNQCHRKWYPELSNSTHGSVESLNVDSVEKTTNMSLDKCDDDDDAMVPADETQSICALCGEPFEDFYCLVRDEWMYKGTTYLSQPEDENETTMNLDDGALGLIVHAKCIQKR